MDTAEQRLTVLRAIHNHHQLLNHFASHLISLEREGKVKYENGCFVLTDDGVKEMYATENALVSKKAQ